MYINIKSMNKYKRPINKYSVPDFICNLKNTKLNKVQSSELSNKSKNSKYVEKKGKKEKRIDVLS